MYGKEMTCGVCMDEELLTLGDAEDLQTSSPPTGPVELTDVDLEKVVGGRSTSCSASFCGQANFIKCC